MNVTRDNFQSLLPLIQNDIKTATFVSFDLEFSGLGIIKETVPDLLDTPSIRYSKVSRVCNEFLPLQVGICTFKYMENGDFYVAKPYNFFVFPRTGNRYFGLDRCFSSQVSSLEFLLSHNFDWAKWMQEGVSYVNHDDYDRIMEKLTSENDSPSLPQKGESMYEYSIETIARAQDFLQNSTEKSVQVPAPSAYHKRIAHISIAKHFNGFIGTSSKQAHVELVKYSEEEREDAFAKTRSSTLKAELEELVGFRRVIDFLVHAKIPLVGHNLLHDLCYVFENFYRQLPLDFEDFKAQVHSNFPLIIDTKLVAQTSPVIQKHVKNTILSDIAEIFQKEPFSQPKIVFGREFDLYEGEEVNYHEAGYDAFITGLSLLRMYNEVIKPEKGTCIDLNSEVCQANRIFMMRSLVNFMSLDGPDPKPDTSNVFMLSKFPVAWKAGDIQHALKELGFINLKWIDDQSCLVIIRDLAKVEVAIEMSKRVYKKSSQFMLKSFIATSTPLVTGEIEQDEPKRKRQRVEIESSDTAPAPINVKRKSPSLSKSMRSCSVM